MPAPKLSGLAHLVIRVRDVDRSVSFYTDVLGLEVQEQFPGMAFLSAPGSTASHELGLMAIGTGAPAPDPLRVGLYHFAWQMDTIKQLEEFHLHLVDRRANIVGYGDHGASFGIYFTDPDGNEIEVFYELPRDQWPSGAGKFRSSFPLSINIQPVGRSTN